MAKGKYEYWLTPEGLLELEGWARDGLTDEQIAYNIGISRSTLNSWKDKYQDISDTLKREISIVQVINEKNILCERVFCLYSCFITNGIKNIGETEKTRI